jgi:phytoene dehydrogenase-like protein
VTEHVDVVIVGGGHNGLTAAAYLAAAGRSVRLLERLPHTGGAAVSAPAFEGLDARLSRYSYLVSLLPQRIVDDLRLDIRLVRRRYSSYTPRPGGSDGLLVDTLDPTSLGDEALAWTRFYDGTSRLAARLFPTVTEPLLTRSEARALVADDRVWEDLIEQPVGRAIERDFADDLVRGVVYTDALIGTFAPDIDPSLAANRCFLYHVIGRGTGDWDVPVGGMGAVTAELLRAAQRAGADIRTERQVTSISPDGLVTYGDTTVQADVVLAGVAPAELDRLVAAASPSELGRGGSDPVPRPEGAQVKVNLLLSRLPRLKDPDVDPVAAFGGTFHVNETWSQLQAAFEAASAGRIPDPLPLEIYCHSLSDPSILSPELAAAGAHTITVFGLHVPDRLLTEQNADEMRAALQAAAIASLDSVLAEPVESLLLTDAEGRPAIETKTTRDVESALRMPGGNIFHGPLSWPFAEDDEPLDTPARRWGVDTRWPRILLCGSGARRGGGVSGIGGHNAAHAVLEG